MNGVHTIKMKELAKGVSAVSGKSVTTKPSGSNESIFSQINGLDEDGIMKFNIDVSNYDDNGNKTNNKSVQFIIGSGEERNETQKKEDSDNNIIRINKSLSEVSIQDIVSKINNATVNVKNIESDEVISSEPLGIQAGYDSGLDKFFIKTKNQGSSSSLSITAAGNDSEEKPIDNDPGQTFLNALGLNFGEKTTTGIYRGKNALVESYTVDGMEFVSKDGEGKTIPIEYKSNNFSINGVNFSAESLEIGKTASITISSNTDEMVNKIKDFVEGYNKIVDKMNSLSGEKKYNSFKPLTAEQREALSDKEVELWDAKAKSGLLKGDDILSKSLQSVRSGLYGEVKGVTGSYNQITNIGISTEKYVSGSMGGKLIIDESALRKQIENDASGVMDLLFKQPTDALSKDDSDLTPSQITEKRAQSGIVTRIFDNLAAGMKDIVDKSGLGNEADILRKVRGKITSDFVIGGSRSRIDKQISEFNKKMDSLTQYLSNKESSYYRRFTAMEQAMQKANSQSGWLSQQFGGGM